jgi:hypothetical protein
MDCGFHFCRAALKSTARFFLACYMLNGVPYAKNTKLLIHRRRFDRRRFFLITPR